MIPDAVLVLDWSAASTPSPARPSADAVWIGRADAAGLAAQYHRTRATALAALSAAVAAALAAGERLLIGADFPFGYPAGFAAALTGEARALALWRWFAAQVEDAPDNANNRFALAAAINARFAGRGPFWGRPAGLDLPGLPARGRDRSFRWPEERRLVERLLPRTQPVWKLYTTGSVGSQAILGIAALARLRAAFAGRIAVWPFEDCATTPVVLAEVWPSLLAAEVRAACAADPAAIRDAVQVRLLAARLYGRDLRPLLAPEAPAALLAEEGWILGAPRL
jgi:hypothetical protein